MNLPLANFVKLFSIINALLEISDNEMDMHLFERLNMICINLKDILEKDGLDVSLLLSSEASASEKKAKKVRKTRRSVPSDRSMKRKGVFKQVYNNGNSYEYVDLNGNKYYVI